MSGGSDGIALKELLDALERLQDMSDAEREAEIDRISAEQPERGMRLRRLLDRQSAAARFFDGLEQSLGRGLAAELDAAWAPGRQVGPYRLERLLATGGMGAVFIARKADGELKRPVALKLVPPGLPTGEARERIRRERDLLAALAHPNIAPLLDAGVADDGQPWFAMEYIEGQRFDAWCARQTSRRRVVEQLYRLAAAVAYAHRNLVVHGDLKPGNVLVDREGRLRLLDFGIARMLEDRGGQSSESGGSRYLTERYAAPEVCAGHRPSPASDVFALGRMLGESVTADRDLEAVAMQACAKTPDARYESAGAFAAELRRWLDGEPVQARNGGAAYRFGKRVRRHPWASSGVAAGLILLIAFGVVSRIQAERYERERDSARQLADFLEQVFVSADPDVAAGKPLTARQLLDRGRAGLATERLDPGVRSRFLSILGRTYQRLGEYAPAGTLIDEALALRPAADAGRFDLVIERAETHRLAGEFERAEARYQDALAGLPEGDRPRRARALAGLGRTLAQAGRPEDGVSLLEQGLTLTLDTPGIDPETLADRRNDLGSALFRLGRFDAAIEQLEAALPLRREADRVAGLAGGSARTATLINNLALMHYLQGRPAEAEPRFREALAMRRLLLPPGHPDRAQTLTNLGLMLKDYGDLDEAIALLDEALTVRQSGLDPDHYRIGQAMLNLGIARRDSGALVPGEALIREALVRLSANLGSSHPQVAVARNELGRLLLERGDVRAAEAEHKRALSIQRDALPEGHPHLAWSLLGLGRALAASGRSDEARAPLAEAVRIRRAHLPDGDPLRLEAEFALAELDSPGHLLTVPDRADRPTDSGDSSN